MKYCTYSDSFGPCVNEVSNGADKCREHVPRPVRVVKEVKPPGRPRTVAPDGNYAFIRVGMTSEDKVRVEQAALAAGTNVSAFSRSIILRHLESVREEHYQPAPAAARASD